VLRCVLAARPFRVREHWTTELFGDYNIESMVIRLRMRTAIKKDVTSFGTLLNTLCHEYCHHLDFHLFGFADSWHTRGFYESTAMLYHFARGTPRKKLFWVRVPGERWRIDGSGRGWGAERFSAECDDSFSRFVESLLHPTFLG
jgi:SprT-like family